MYIFMNVTILLIYIDSQKRICILSHIIIVQNVVQVQNMQKYCMSLLIYMDFLKQSIQFMNLSAKAEWHKEKQ